MKLLITDLEIAYQLIGEAKNEEPNSVHASVMFHHLPMPILMGKRKNIFKKHSPLWSISYIECDTIAT